MKTEQLFKKLRAIEPDPGYTRASRLALFGIREPAARPRGPFGVLIHGFQFGSAIALTAVLLLLIVGGVSAWRTLSPWRILSLDAPGLRAEAQAVDIQIELADVSYTEPLNLKNAIPTVPVLPRPKGKAAVTSSAPMSLDEALEKLAE